MGPLRTVPSGTKGGKMININIDGKDISVKEGSTILEAARQRFSGRCFSAETRGWVAVL